MQNGVEPDQKNLADLHCKFFMQHRNDENHETGQIQAKGPSGEERRPTWRRTKPPSGEG